MKIPRRIFLHLAAGRWHSQCADALSLFIISAHSARHVTELCNRICFRVNRNIAYSGTECGYPEGLGAVTGFWIGAGASPCLPQMTPK
jgi:hypothetical protein